MDLPNIKILNYPLLFWVVLSLIALLVNIISQTVKALSKPPTLYDKYGKLLTKYLPYCAGSLGLSIIFSLLLSENAREILGEIF